LVCSGNTTSINRTVPRAFCMIRNLRKIVPIMKG
jgi:hypothetical protein